jgi:UDP-xylose/UDP-N-acetylglucosamine transporter B4
VPSSGNMMTLGQFLLISVTGFVSEARCGRRRPAVPLVKYFYSVALFFAVSVLNNLAFNFNISMPFHMIFRSVSVYIYYFYIYTSCSSLKLKII